MCMLNERTNIRSIITLSFNNYNKCDTSRKKMTMTKIENVNILDSLMKKREDLVRCVEMTTERVKTAEVELEDTYMIEDENDKSIEEQKCSDQYEKYKDHLETITEKLNYHNEVESYLGVICELNIQKVRLHNA
jgi:hypothetical protein